MPIVQNLVVDEYGAYVGKYSQRVKVTKKGEVLAQAPLLHLESLTIASRGVSLSADLVQACTERGIPIFFVSNLGRAYASLYSSGLTGTIATRRAQLTAYDDSRGLRLAMAFGMGKLGNQANLLKYIAKYRKEVDAELYRELRDRTNEILDHLVEIEGVSRYPEVENGEATVDDLRAELLGLEGRGSQRYWAAVKRVLPENYGFPGRKGRGAKDPINSALNYGYGILYGVCERCLTLAGLDPYAGFLHADRPGKPSLVLDFIEEFRQPAVDRTVIGMANKGGDFAQAEEGLLTRETRRMLAERVNARLEASTPYEGKKHPLRSVIQMQARHLATFLRAERASYEPFTMTW